jgi:hypothetical protein
MKHIPEEEAEKGRSSTERRKRDELGAAVGGLLTAQSMFT